MSMVSVPRFIMADRIANTGVGTTTLDGANERVAHCGLFTTPDGATRHITHICWATGPVTTGDDILVQLETIDVDTGLPAGVIGGGSPISATQTVADGNDTTWFETALDNHYDLTSGTFLACTFKMTNASKALEIIKSSSYNAMGGSDCAWLCTDIVGAATWITATYKPNVALKTSLGEYLIPSGGQCYLTAGYVAVNTGSNPRYVGNKIQCDVKTRLVGFMLQYFDMDYNITVKLVDANGTVIVGDDAATNMQVTLDAHYRTGSGALYSSEFQFPCPKTLDADTAYYLIFSPDTASDLRLYRVGYTSEAIKNIDAGIPTGWSLNYISATTNWDNVDHVTETAAYMGLLLPMFDQMELTASGGGRPEFRGGNL